MDRRFPAEVSTIRYAAYGSNLHPVRLTERLPSARLVGTALVPDRTLEFHKQSVDGSAKCTILEGGEGVHVAIYDISGSDKDRLDEIEGVGRGYSDERIDVPGFGLCATYVAEPTHLVTDRSPYRWYQALVVEGCRFHGFPARYIERIASVGSVRDPDDARRARNDALVERLERA
jgi:hypothetical protein